MPNHLASETSPYLLQHKDNPVDWYPWGEEALARAREEQKPIFLSIGYSACHWCHVMAHESFENEQIAAYLNEHFICIKVDREERPDIDQLYMNAVQLLTGRGGWPMSVFLTPDLKPFYGGTYWPPTASRGMPGFDQVLAAVNDAWRNRREQTLAHADQLTGHIQSLGFPDRGEQRLSADMLAAAGKALERDYDAQHGGFGGAPKFPHTMDLQVLLRLWRRDGRQAWLDMVTNTLDKMAAGGIYDHLGGGFARYSVDARWLVPHFEKMLYDNALLSTAYTEAFVATGNQDYARVVRETLDYVLRDMTDPAGGFYSTEDADSPLEEGGHGEEGAFYVWTPDQVQEVLGEEDADLFCRVYDVTPGGNFEGKNILNLPKTIAQQAKLLGRDEAELRRQLAGAREKLLAARDQRIRPGRDDKVLVSWNGLMIDAMARAGAALGEPRYVQAARNSADFILRDMSPSVGRLRHSWRDGKAKIDGYLDDYTALTGGLVSLYEATFDERYVDASVELMGIVLDKFADKDDGAFFYTADDQEELIARTKEITDGATPSGTSLAATALLRLGKLTGNPEYLTAAHETLKVAAPLMERVPLAMGQMLIALDLEVGPTYELVFAGDGDARRMADGVHRQFFPRRVLAYRSGDASDGYRSKLLDAALGGKKAVDGEPTLYVCQDQVCQQPAVGADDVTAALDAL